MSNKLAASKAGQRKACPGSWILENKYPSELGDAAKEGIAAHQVLARYILSGELLPIDSVSENGEIITEEMHEGAVLVDEDVTKRNLDQIFVETHLTMPYIHPLSQGDSDIFGLKYNANKSLITDVYIWDYKFGRGYIEAFENWQLIAYAVGIWCTEYHKKMNDNTKFHLIIAQPRCFIADPVRTWTVTLSALISDFFPELRESEIAATMPNAQCIPSPACEYCTARHACMALQNSAARAIDSLYENQALELNETGLSNELRLLQRAKKLIEARLDGLETEALVKLQGGVSIPHFTIDYSRPREQWEADNSSLQALGEIYNIKILKNPEPVTPAQAVKLGLHEELKEAYSKRPQGKPKLSPVKEKDVRKIFSTKH